MEAIIIIKRILNLEVSLTIGKLLAFALVVKKWLTKAISEDKIVQFRINTLSLTEVLTAPTPYS